MNDQMSNIGNFQEHHHSVQKIVFLVQDQLTIWRKFLYSGILLVVVDLHSCITINSQRCSFLQITINCWLTNTKSMTKAAVTHTRFVVQQVNQLFVRNSF